MHVLAPRRQTLPAPLVLLLLATLIFSVLPIPQPRPFVPPPPVPELRPATPDAPPPALPDSLLGKPEVIAGRTAFSAIYQVGEGQYALLQDPAPLHYRADDGSWQPINPAFAATPGGWISAANALRTGIDERSSKARIFLPAPDRAAADRPDAGAVGLIWQPQALELTAAGATEALATALPSSAAAPGVRNAAGTAVRYSQGWSLASIQDQWQADRGSSAYTMRLGERPLTTLADPEQLDLLVAVQLYPGTQLFAGDEPASLPLETSAPLRFVGGAGDAIVLQPPYIYEQGRRTVGSSGLYVVEPTADPQTVTIRVRFPWSWLADPQRAYPLIIDPLFQIRSPLEIRQAQYSTSSSNRLQQSFDRIVDVGDQTAVTLGLTKTGASRLLLGYTMPPMPYAGVPAPNGTNVVKAYLYAVPTGLMSGEFARLQLPVAAHALEPQGWPENGTAPVLSADTLPADTTMMRFSKGAAQQTGVRWDVTDQARRWLTSLPIPEHQRWVVLRSVEEGVRPLCLFDSDTQFASANCNHFAFNTQPDAWGETEDLEPTQAGTDPNAPTLGPSSNGGLRLVVFYNGPALRLNEPYLSEANALPQGRGDAPYYQADHVFNVSAVQPGRWQALAVRGLAPAPQTTPGQPAERPLQGALGMDLRTANDATSLARAEPAPGTVGYIAVNGRNATTPRPSYSLHIAEPEGGATAYEVRRIEEALSIPGNANGQPTTRTYQFKSGDPLALFDLSLPANTVNQITIRITPPNGYSNKVPFFTPEIIASNGLNDIYASTDLERRLEDTLVLTQGSGESKAFFGQPNLRYALALAYNGPRIFIPEEGPPPPNLVADEAQAAFTPPPGTNELIFSVNITLVSCPAGSLPAGNRCQQVECPEPNAAYYRETNEFGMWSPSGWTTADAGAGFGTSISTGPNDVAPLIGARGAGQPQAHLVVTRGTVQYDATQSPPKVFTSADSYIYLIKCSGATYDPKDTLHVYSGMMQRDVRSGQFLQLPVLRGTTAAAIKNKPWLLQDRQHLTEEILDLAPASGTAYGSARLRRVIESRTLYFRPNWSFDYRGLAHLTSAVAAENGNPAPPPVASLAVALGSAYSLDFSPNSKAFVALRAKNGTVTQSANFGGASKPIQALILPNGALIDDPEVTRDCGVNRSCLDLRAPSDTYQQPDRNWEMPDVLTGTKANTVMLSREGETLIFSSDHPDAHVQNLDEEYSFSAFRSRVRVTQEVCTEGGPKVTVIRGDGYVALPNIGSTTDPAGAIAAGFKLCETTPGGDPNLRNVYFTFDSPVGIPVGTTGMFLTYIHGDVTIEPTGTRIEVDFEFQSPADGSTFTGWGKVAIDTRGLFELQGGGNVLGVVGVSGRLWVAWNPLDIGIQVTASIGNWLSGSIYAHMWRGQGWQNRYHWLPDNDEIHITGSIEATLQIDYASITPEPLPFPPFDISFSVGLAFGQFCTNSSCSAYEWGVKGWFEVLSVYVGLYYGFDTGLDLSLSNSDHILIDQFGSPGLNLAQADDGLNLAPPPPVVDGVATQEFTVSEGTEGFLAGMHWIAGNPSLTLIQPDGTPINPENAEARNAEVFSDLNQRWYGVQRPMPGVWQARIAGLRGDGSEHYGFGFFGSKGAPGNFGAAQGASLNAVDRLTIAPRADGTFDIAWVVPEDALEQHQISLFYRPADQSDTPQAGLPIVEHQPYRAGSYRWNPVGVPSGAYEVYAVVHDGVNDLPVEAINVPDDSCIALPGPYPQARNLRSDRFPGVDTFSAAAPVTISDTVRPARPETPQLSLVDGAIMVRLTPAQPDLDTTHYEVLWGPGNAALKTFLPEHIQRVAVGPDGELELRLGTVKQGIVYGVTVVAIDASGNRSLPSSDKVAFLTVNGAGQPIPPQPLNLARIAGDSSSVSLSWSAGNGPAPAGYQVTLTRLDAGQRDVRQFETAGTSLSIADLPAGATFDASVAARNSAGWYSRASEPLRLVISDGVDGDSDGLPDDWATARGLKSAQIALSAAAGSDSDRDGLGDAAEFAAGTDPLAQDSDGDGMSDGEEQTDASDPLSSRSYTAIYRQPRLAVAEDTLDFRVVPGSANLAAMSSAVAFSNVGGGALQLQAVSDAPWITAGVQGNQVQVGIRPEAMQAAGYYSGVVRLTQAGADPLVGAPQCIRVRAVVYPGAPDPAPDASIRYYLPLIRR